MICERGSYVRTVKQIGYDKTPHLMPSDDVFRQRGRSERYYVLEQFYPGEACEQLPVLHSYACQTLKCSISGKRTPIRVGVSQRLIYVRNVDEVPSLCGRCQGHHFHAE